MEGFPSHPHTWTSCWWLIPDPKEGPSSQASRPELSMRSRIGPVGAQPKAATRCPIMRSL